MADNVQEESNITLQPDSNPVLYEGMATPYLAIFDGGQQPIMDDLTQLPIGVYVTNFEYNYDEDDDDNGNFTMECNNPDLVAHPSFKYKMPLCLQWGYIYPKGDSFIGPLRKVIVIGNESEFTETGVKITINFASASILAKNFPAKYYDRAKGILDYLTPLLKGGPVSVSANNFQQEVTYTKVVFQKVLTNSDLQKGGYITPYQNGESNYSSLNRLPGKELQGRDPSNGIDNAFFPIPLVFLGTQPPSIQHPDVIGAVALDYDKNKHYLKIDPTTFQEGVIAEQRSTVDIICGTPKNFRNQLVDVMNKVMPVPMHWGGRDGKLIGQTKKITRPVTKVYTYYGGSGELLTFTGKSKFVANSVEVAKSSDVDPDTGNIKTKVFQAAVDPDMDNPDSIFLIQTGRQWTDTKPDLGNNPDPNGGNPSQRIAEQAPYNPYAYKALMDPTYQANLKKKQAEKKAQEEAAAKEEAEKKSQVFNSEEDAIAYIQNYPALTQEEVDAYLNHVKQRSEELFGSTPTTGEKMGQNIHDINDIPTWTIKRKVRVRYIRNPLDLYPKERNQINASITNRGGATYSPVNQQSQLDAAWNRAYEHLKSEQGVVIEGRKKLSTGGIGTFSHNQDQVVYTKELELEIPMDGVRMMGTELTLSSGISFANDVVNTITNQITAEATVVGDPTLESSMNFQIQNVSKKYSGVWYAKKVTHRISSSVGYVCDINFEQREVPISKITIDGTMITKKVLALIYGQTKEAEQTEAYKMKEVVESKVEAYKRQLPPGKKVSTIAIYDDKNERYDIYAAEADFPTQRINSLDELKEAGITPEYIGSVSYKNRPK